MVSHSRITLAILIVVIGVSIFSSGMLYLQQQQLLSNTSNLSVLDKRSGPISMWPAAWSNVCNIPKASTGNDTTNNNLAYNYTPGLGNISLDQLYSRIINSSSFQNIASSRGWVTTFWGTQESGGPGYFNTYVVTQFILTSDGKPDGYLTTYYDVSNGTVTSNYQTSLMSSCPSGESESSSSEVSLGKSSPAFFAIGEPVNITFSEIDYLISNMTVSSESSCIGAFEVLLGGTSGPLVYNSTEHPFCTSIPLYLVLHPGQSYNQSFVWNQAYDNGTHVPYGEYEIMETTSQHSYYPVGVVYLGIPVPITSTSFANVFHGGVNTNRGQYHIATPVKISASWSNIGFQIVDLETSSCSLSYEILNLTNGLVYSSKNHLSCGSLQENPIPPMGSLGATEYWNQTSDSGRQVPAGMYQVLETLSVASNGQEMNQTSRAVFQLGSSANTDVISISSSTISSTGLLWAKFVTTSNLSTVSVYVNGVRVANENYSGLCCAVSYELTIHLALKETVPADSGSYVLVLVGKFQDGNTSATWSSPVSY